MKSQIQFLNCASHVSSASKPHGLSTEEGRISQSNLPSPKLLLDCSPQVLVGNFQEVDDTPKRLNQGTATQSVSPDWQYKHLLGRVC